MQDFRELAVWKRAHGLVLEIYLQSKNMPQNENFGLTLQLRRSAMAMATRISEGAGKPNDAEFAAELKRARATGYELEYLLLLCRDLEFIQESVYEALVSEVVALRKMLSAFLKTLTSGR